MALPERRPVHSLAVAAGGAAAVACSDTAYVYVFPAGPDGLPTAPAAELVTPAPVSGVAYDPAGCLWVACEGGAVVMFSEGSPTPAALDATLAAPLRDMAGVCGDGWRRPAGAVPCAVLTHVRSAVCRSQCRTRPLRGSYGPIAGARERVLRAEETSQG